MLLKYCAKNAILKKFFFRLNIKSNPKNSWQYLRLPTFDENADRRPNTNLLSSDSKFST